MLEQCKITGFADEIDGDIQIQIQTLKELNQKYLELRSVKGKNISNFTLEEAAVLKKVLSEANIQVSAIGSPIGKIGIKDDFAPHFELYRHVVALAHIFETKYIRIFSFYVPEEKANYYQSEVFKRMKQMIDYAEKENVILLHENEKGIYGDCTERCLALMEAFYGDHFQCTFDFANFVQCQVDTLNAYHVLQNYIQYIHIKDAMLEDGKVVPPGEGDGKLHEILQLINDKGYLGFLSLEPHLGGFLGFSDLEKNAENKITNEGKITYKLAYNALLKLIKNN